MRLGRIRVPGPDGMTTRIVVSGGEQAPWVDLRAAVRHRAERRGATQSAALRLAEAVAPSSLSAGLAAGDQFLEAAREAVEELPAEAMVPQPDLTNAVDPTGYRDFMLFQGHFSYGYRWQSKPVPDVMYEMPTSYFGNPLAFYGPGDEIPWPSYSKRLDYELEFGIVIGREGRNLTPDQALGHVAGLTILNDVSARDIQAREMTAGLGPSKGKHFACITGPWLTTLDEIFDRGLRMLARVNGETWCDSRSDEMIWSIAEVVAWASQEEMVVPGMLLGSGTCDGGSTLEIERRLSPGDVVEFEIESLGVLRNTIGRPGHPAWTPTPRQRDAATGETNERYFLK